MFPAPVICLTSQGGKKGLAVSIPSSTSQTDRCMCVPSRSRNYLGMLVLLPASLPALGCEPLRTGTVLPLSLFCCSAQSPAGSWHLEVLAQGRGSLLSCG